MVGWAGCAIGWFHRSLAKTLTDLLVDRLFLSTGSLVRFVGCLVLSFFSFSLVGWLIGLGVGRLVRSFVGWVDGCLFFLLPRRRLNKFIAMVER